MPRHPENAIYYRRMFLNREGYNSSAHVIANVNRDYSYHSLKLTDCSRSIELEFSMAGRGDRRNSLHKAELLARTLTEFTEALREYERENQVGRPRRSRRTDS